MARAIMKERKKREAEGALRTVGECLEKALLIFLPPLLEKTPGKVKVAGLCPFSPP
jgi:hypothetical protein